MNYFVTGGTGFIGGRVVQELVEAGHCVTALVRDPQKAGALTDLGVKLAQGDITDRDSLRKGMTGADGVFHIAGWYRLGQRDKSPGERVNVTGTRNVLVVMKELEIPRGVYTSTLAVNSDTHGKLVDETYRYHGPHLSEYDRTKWVAHYEVAEPMMQQGLPLVIVMPGAVYGPGDTGPTSSVFTQYLERKLPLLPQGTAFCWGHVEDTARGHLLAMEKGQTGQSYIIAGPACTLIDVFALAEKITGIKAPGLHLPTAVQKSMASVMEIVEKVVPVPETYASETLRESAGATYLASSEKAYRELGFTARPLEEGLQELFKTMRAST